MHGKIPYPVNKTNICIPESRYTEPHVQHVPVITNNQAASTSVKTTANLFELVPCTASSFHLDYNAMKQELITSMMFTQAIKPAFICWMKFIKEFHINLFLFARAVLEHLHPYVYTYVYFYIEYVKKNHEAPML